VKVFVGGVETFLFTWVTGSSISITTAPANLALVLIQRVTPTTPIVDFVDGSTLTESLLDTSSLQGLYVVEEGRDIADSSMLLDVTDNKYDADSKVIKNVANPVNPQDAATKAWSESAVTASVAQATASASTAASQADISTAQAVIATAKANESSASANTATLGASTATTKASEANTSAINAASSASTATTKASEANTSAINAAASASTATTKASEANTSAINAAASASSASSSEANAAASAAGVNLPALTVGDKGKTLLVNNTGTGYVFSEGALGFRNKIIGGDFTTNPWQRGTSFTGLAAATVNYTADRFHYFQTAAGAIVSVLKTADAPSAAQAGIFTQHCLHIDVTTNDVAIAATENHQLVQLVEGFNSASFGFGQAGTRNVTLSFWHKHTKTGVHCVSIRNSASDRSYVAEYTQDLTDTWEKATVTIPVDTTGTWLYDNGIGLRVAFALSAGTNFQTAANTWAAGNFIATANQVNNLDSTANNFKIDLVQLEAGSIATPFETRSVGQELALCQRYYFRTFPAAVGKVLANGWASSTTSASGNIAFPIEMRIEPTALEQNATANNYALTDLVTSVVCSAVPTLASGSTSKNFGGVVFTVASGLTQFRPYRLVSDATNGATAYLGWNAEL
jgi:hypothetical protein